MNARREPHPASVMARIEQERKLLQGITCARASAYIDFTGKATFCVKCVKRQRFMTGFFVYKRIINCHILYNGRIKFRACKQCKRQILQYQPASHCPECILRFYKHREEWIKLGEDGDNLPEFVLSYKPPPLILFVTPMRHIYFT